MSWSTISEEEETSFWQESSSPRIQRGRSCAQKILNFQPDSRGKWAPNYEGPYVVKRAISGDAMTLQTMDGEELPRIVNTDAVKKYFV